VKSTLSEVEAAEADDESVPADEQDDASGAGRVAVLSKKVKLSVEIDEGTFESAINDAFHKIAREIRLPGFRPGKAPRKVIESRIGSGYARAQALEDAVPEYYAQAVREHEVDVISAPEIDVTSGTEDGPVVFDAIVEVRPEISIGGYDQLEVEIPNPVPSDEDVNEQIDTVRGQHADLEEVERAAAVGDNVNIDINGEVDGEPLPGLAADDYLYEVGSGGIVPEVDERLTGAGAGDEFEFVAPHPVQEDVEIAFSITVNSVQERVLPDLTDEWVEENTEFETVDEMREDTKSRMQMMRTFQANSALREKAAEGLAELVIDDVPDALVNGEMSEQLQQLAMQLQGQGMNMEQWLSMTGQDPASFTGELKVGAERSAKVDLALRALARQEELEVSDEDLDEEIERIATQLEEAASEIRHRLEHGDGYAPIRSDLLKRQAMEWLIEQVNLVDEDGQAIDRSDLEPPELPTTNTEPESSDEDDGSPDPKAEAAED